MVLLYAAWAPEMLALPPLRPQHSADGSMLFRGPRVKTGIYQSTPRDVCPHSTTGRADYWGELVNRAARMMAAGKPGQLLCVGEVVTKVLPRICSPPELRTNEHAVVHAEFVTAFSTGWCVCLCSAHEHFTKYSCLHVYG